MALEGLRKSTEEIWGPFLKYFELEPHDLKRLALFLLAHAHLDRWLIHATAVYEFKRQVSESSVVPTLELLDQLVGQHAKEEFGAHMERARKAGLLGGVDHICTEVNKARNHFLHWEPGRFKVPTYQGQPVTTEEGFLRCLSDIDDVIRALKTHIDAA